MSKARDKVLERTGGARPYIERALTDEDLRDNVRNAFESAREVYNELLGGRGAIPLATRVATDKEIQDRLREAIFTERRSEEVVRDISDVKHEIVSYRKVIKPERSTLRLLERTRYLPDDLEVYFDDIVDKAERIWDQLDNYKEVVEALEATNESVIAHKQNDILRVLTIFSVILLPLTLVSGIFGMNFHHIPLTRDYHAFVATVATMLVIAIAMLGFFRFKRWI